MAIEVVMTPGRPRLAKKTVHAAVTASYAVLPLRARLHKARAFKAKLAKIQADDACETALASLDPETRALFDAISDRKNAHHFGREALDAAFGHIAV